MDFSTKTVLCVGDVMVDSYMLGHVSRISPEAPVPILQLSQSRSVLGGAGNVARNIAEVKLGLRDRRHVLAADIAEITFIAGSH